jgi:hypothetical protein
MMVVFRFMAIIWVAVLIVASLNSDAFATTITYGPQSHYSSMDSPDHDNCDGAGNQDVTCRGCCQGISCASSGVLAQVAVNAPIMLLTSRPEPNPADHLSGRSIAPETGPPKLLA